MKRVPSLGLKRLSSGPTMHSEVVAFAIPSRVALETDDGRRWTGYVTHFEGGCIWVYLRSAPEPSFRSSVRLVFRREGEASLGMAGEVIWSAQDRVAVEVQHPVDTAIVGQWARGEAADVSDFVRLHGAELPTAELYPVGKIVNSAPVVPDTDVSDRTVIKLAARARREAGQ